MSTKNGVTFLHLRRLDEHNTANSFGGVTIAIQEQPGGVTYAIARCNDKDRYVKKTGRIKAEARLFAKNPEDAAYRRTLPGVTSKQFIDNVYTNIYTSVGELLFKV